MSIIEANPEIITQLPLKEVPLNSKSYYWMQIISDALGNAVYMPIMIARGTGEGPILGLTAAVHGNEVNGSQIIQKLFRDLNPEELNGTVIGVPVVNVPAFNKIQRKYIDGEDLNRIMPGRENGNDSQVFAYRFFHRVVRKFDYLLDLHTASFGRINSYYIRADMKHPVARKLARLQNADIIVHNKPSDGTLRGAADEYDIPAITLEVGDPNTFQKRMIKSGIQGIHNTLAYLEMIPDEMVESEVETIVCNNSYWIYTDLGGLLSVNVGLKERVRKGQVVAILRDAFGFVRREYVAPEDGIVVGKSTTPANQTGGRILHLGIER